MDGLEGMSPEQTKTNVVRTELVTIGYPLNLRLGNTMTIYLEADLQTGITKERVYSGNSITHVKDTVLYKQN